MPNPTVPAAATGLPAAMPRYEQTPNCPYGYTPHCRETRHCSVERRDDPKAPTLAELIDRERIRSRIEAAVARLIDALDAIDGDADAEPSLGSIGSACGCQGWPQAMWGGGTLDDREEQNEDGGDILDEPHDEEPDEENGDERDSSLDEHGIADEDGLAEQMPGKAPALAFSMGGYVA